MAVVGELEDTVGMAAMMVAEISPAVMAVVVASDVGVVADDDGASSVD